LTTVAVLAVLSTAGVALVLVQRAAMTDSLDETLQGVAEAVRDRLDAGQVAPLSDLLLDEFTVQVLAPDRSVVLATPDDTRTVDLGLGPVDDDGVRATVVPAGDDEPVRVVALRADGDLTVVVASGLDDIQESTDVLARSLFAAVPAVVAVLSCLVWWSVGRTLRPVEDMRRRVEQISSTRSPSTVPEPSTHDEVARLARTMNAMLARLFASSEQQRRFVADASHELRGPLARIRAELEVDQAHPATADPAATGQRVLADAVTLQGLADDLLLLARGDAGVLDLRGGVPVDLDDVVQSLSRASEPADPPRIDARDVAPVQVVGDASQLRRAVANLLDNARRHAREAVTVTLTEDPPGWAQLTVTDDGPGIPPDKADTVFERFARLDEARSSTDAGAGLGLAIARDVATRHGGTLRLDTDHLPGARFVLRVPLDGAATARRNPK
jgi:signal transduction histidine kinase